MKTISSSQPTKVIKLTVNKCGGKKGGCRFPDVKLPYMKKAA